MIDDDEDFKRIARTIKPHYCDWCGEKIEVGTSCRRERAWTTEMMLRNAYWHPECHAVFLQQIRHECETGERVLDDLHFGEFERGSKYRRPPADIV